MADANTIHEQAARDYQAASSLWLFVGLMVVGAFVYDAAKAKKRGVLRG